MNAIDRAIDLLGNQTKLAEALGVSPMAVTQWKRRGVPAERCVPIEEATSGEVTRYDLRPDIFGPAPAKRTRKAA